MGKLFYSMSVSLDGFVNTSSASLDWNIGSGVILVRYRAVGR